MSDALTVAGDISCAGLTLLFLLLKEPRHSLRYAAVLLSAVFAVTAATYTAADLAFGLMPGRPL